MTTLLYLKDSIDGQIKTFEFSPMLEGPKTIGATISVYPGQLKAEELESEEVESFIALDRESWEVFLVKLSETLRPKYKLGIVG